MKKIIAVLLVTFMALGLITACGVDASNETADFAPASPPPSFRAAMPVEEPEAELMVMSFYGAGAVADVTDEMFFIDDDITWDSPQTLTPEMPVLPGAPEPPRTEAGDGFAEKIIYTISADVETLEFDETIEAVYKMLEQNGAFIESSNVGGRNHWQIRNNMPSYRYAFFTLRVPQDRLEVMASDLDTLGNVLSVRRFAENITAQFVDTEARLNALRIQEERLLDMLRRAEEISDMIVIEESLANVRHQIESIVSTLRNWENRIRFSTLHLSIQEVHEYTELEPPEEVPYWQQIWDGLGDTFTRIGLFFSGLFMWFVINLPILIILAVFAAIVIYIIYKINLRRRTKVNLMKEKNIIAIKEKKVAEENNDKKE